MTIARLRCVATALGLALCLWGVWPASAQPAPERLSADTPRTTATGNSFVAPAGWSLLVRDNAIVLEAPEGGSFVALVDVQAGDADAAVAAAWQAYRPDAKWPLKVVTPAPERDGWRDHRVYSYQVSPNERRDVEADVRRANDVWTVVIYDMAHAVGEKRGAQVAGIYGKLLPRGMQRESFAGRKAHALDAARLAELRRFVERAMALTQVPGVSLAVVQDGTLVHAGGFGVRSLGRPQAVDADTRFMVASNTKGLVTLMLARLVQRGLIDWETPVAQVWPQFTLGDAQTTRSVKVKHLICACTGMPRQDMEWLLEFGSLTPGRAMRLLGTMQPTSTFGELFQYSNVMAAAAGFLGGHLLHPRLELGAAYDRAMRDEVFGPLAMNRSTHDFTLARRGNAAEPHAPGADGRSARAVWQANLSIVPVRPAGGLWSTANDMIRYVAMELADGRLGDGSRYLAADTLASRRAPQVATGADTSYGMGLMTNRVWGTPLVHHGGDMIGFHSDMMWLPEHGVGAVILTNGDPGWLIRSTFRRKLLEVLFDGRPEADAQIAAQAKAYYDELAAERRLLAVPPDVRITKRLAPRYVNSSLGTLSLGRRGAALWLSVGEWTSELASRSNPDGTTSLLTISPGVAGFEFVVSPPSSPPTLTLRDAQHEYRFIATR